MTLPNTHQHSACGCATCEAPATRTARKPLNFFSFLWARPEARLALGAGLLLGIAVLVEALGGPLLLVRALQIAALSIAGYPVARSGLLGLIKEHEFNINLLTSVAALGAIFIGEWTEAATLMFLFAIAEALEDYAVARSRSALGELDALLPETALRLVNGQPEVVSVNDLAVGNRLLVRPGERVPMDGQVAAGQSEVNQAPITGESLPVEKATGDEVFAGTVNGSGALEIEVTRRVTENTLHRIIEMVEEAQARRAPVQRIIDRFARVYTPAVMVLAALTAALPPLLFGAPFLDTPDGRGWLYRALALLVISCPCALVISAPATILSGITAAARQGVLVKGGAFIEALAQVRLFAFDKTGTLTLGHPVVLQARCPNCPDGAHCADCDQVLALAAALEQRSAHPLAQAVINAADARGLAGAYAPAEAVTTLAGLGLRGEINGSPVTVGSHRLFEAEHPHPAQFCAWVEQAERQGQMAMLVADGADVRGLITAADELRPESPAVIAALHELGCQTALLTGDNPGAAQSVAARVGIDTVNARLLPADKLAAIAELRAAGPVAMVGDGINDAPALAAADVGIAMGGAGSAQAMETADVVLMADGLAQLPGAVRLARQVRMLIKQNIAFSLLAKLAFMALALGGITTLWLAVLADTGITLLVTANGMRPLARR